MTALCLILTIPAQSVRVLSDGKGGERMFYEELEENAQPQPLAAEDGAQYIEEDVPPFYDAMAEEYAAYEEEEAKQQAAASNFLDEFPG